MTILTALWGRIAGYVAALGVLLTMIASIWWKGRQDGKELMREEQERHRREALEAKRKRDSEIDDLGPADVDQRFERWVRGPEQR